MLNEQQFKQVEHSYKHENVLVARIGNDVYVCDKVIKHQKEGTIELKDCVRVDETCFEKNGDYYGDITNDPLKNFILDDCYADSESAVASVYYEDEIREIWN